MLVPVAPRVAVRDLGFLAHLADARGLLLTTLLRHRREVDADLLALEHRVHPKPPSSSIALLIAWIALASKGLISSCTGSGTLIAAIAFRSVCEP